MIVRAHHQGSIPWLPPAPPVRRRGLHGLGDEGAPAVIVGARQGLPPGELARRGMAGMGDVTVTSVLDQLTGGRVTQVSDQMDRLELGLQLSIAASMFAGLAALIALRRR
jgi:hypothetical protein